MNDEQRELLIAGYIRNIEQSIKLSSDVPSDVQQIIICQYSLPFRFQTTEDIVLSDDGLSAYKDYTDQYVLLQFGEFLHRSDDIILEVIFDLINVSSTASAFGFISPEYVEPLIKQTLNYGDNHTMSLTGIGYMVTTPLDFHSVYTVGTTQWIYQFDEFWGIGDKLHIEIDMIHQKGKMWNDKNKENIFEISLPKSAAILVDFGIMQQKLSVISHTFRYQ